MNVKEHIEAGHYPTDDKGRALVPTAHGRDTVAVICATDKPGRYPLLGWLPTPARVQSIEFAWDENGGAAGDSNTERLLPPPPRKVKVTAYAQIASNGDIRRFARSDVSLHLHGCAPGMDEDRVVELTGEYDQGWE